MTSIMESTKDAKDSANTTAYDYVHAKLLADFEAMSNKLSTLPTEIALTGLEKHRRLIIDAELNPKTIEDSDTFEAAYQALKNFRDGQKCDLEMLINGSDGVLEMLNRCLAALEEAETEIATLRSKEGTKAVCPGQKMRKLTKEKEELEQEVEGLMEEIKVLKGKAEFQEGSASGSCSGEGEGATIKPQDQAQQHEETGPRPEAVSEAPANGVAEDAERNDCLPYGARKILEREEVDWCLGRLAKIWDDWRMQESEMLGLPNLKLENEGLKKKLDEIRDVTIDLLMSMDRLANVAKGPLGEQAPSENAGNAPRNESDEDEKDGSGSPSWTSATATNEDNDA